MVHGACLLPLTPLCSPSKALSLPSVGSEGWICQTPPLGGLSTVLWFLMTQGGGYRLDFISIDLYDCRQKMV